MTTAAGVTGEIHARSSDDPRELPVAVERLQRDGGSGLADEIDRQRSAMRAAVVLMVAGEDAPARIR